MCTAIGNSKVKKITTDIAGIQFSHDEKFLPFLKGGQEGFLCTFLKNLPQSPPRKGEVLCINVSLLYSLT
jgi:hypothetical protein